MKNYQKRKNILRNNLPKSKFKYSILGREHIKIIDWFQTVVSRGRKIPYQYNGPRSFKHHA